MPLHSFMEHSPLIGIDDCPINEEEMWPVHTGY